MTSSKIRSGCHMQARRRASTHRRQRKNGHICQESSRAFCAIGSWSTTSTRNSSCVAFLITVYLGYPFWKGVDPIYHLRTSASVSEYRRMDHGLNLHHKCGIKTKNAPKQFISNIRPSDKVAFLHTDHQLQGSGGRISMSSPPPRNMRSSPNRSLSVRDLLWKVLPRRFRPPNGGFFRNSTTFRQNRSNR